MGERGGGDGDGYGDGRMIMTRQRKMQNIHGLKPVWNGKMVGCN